jgi:hypothetical protein
LKAEAEETPARLRYRRIAALVVLVVGAAAIATTVSAVKKEPVAIHVLLPAGIRGLRLDVQRRSAPRAALVEHLEWRYPQDSPPQQDVNLELAPDGYLVTLHPLGAGRDPGPRDLVVEKGEPGQLSFDLRTP